MLSEMASHNPLQSIWKSKWRYFENAKVRSEKKSVFYTCLFLNLHTSQWISLSLQWFDFFPVVTLSEIHTKEETKEEEKAEYFKQIFCVLWSVNLFCGHQECAITQSKPACQRAHQCVRFSSVSSKQSGFPSVEWTMN